MDNNNQDMEFYQRFIRKGLWYLEQEGFTADRGDGVARWKSFEELDECIRMLGGEPDEINTLCAQAIQESYKEV